MKKNYIIIYSILAIIIVAFIGYNIKETSVGYAFDESIISALAVIRNDSLTKPMKIITFLGSGEFLIFLGIILFGYIYKRLDKKYMLLVLNSLFVSYLVNIMLKNYYERIRPIKYMIIEQTGYSYPSGHSMISMSFYLTLSYIIYRNMKSKLLRSLICLINILVVLLIGFSRVYLGVHWPTDVLAGFLVGSLIFIWGIYIYEDRGVI